jgi:transcriptional regulator with XRE-family HTH domain
MSIRLRVREFSEARGINQAQLARRSDLGTNTVYELWRNIRTENVRIGTIVRIAGVLGVNWCDLVEVTVDEPLPRGEEPTATARPWGVAAQPTG